MTKTTVAQVELLSQQLTRRFKKINDLMNEAWLEHYGKRTQIDQTFLII
jgi:hypothetical protein